MCGKVAFSLCLDTLSLADVIQFCSGITGGRVLNEEFYAQRLQKLIYLDLSTDCFMKIFLHIDGTYITEIRLVSCSVD